MLMNYVDLQPQIPRRLHFTDDYYVERDIVDGVTGKTKRIRSLIFQCDEVDGRPSAQTFSVLSKNLHDLLEPYLREKAYRNWTFTITKEGSGWAARFKVEATLRGP